MIDPKLLENAKPVQIGNDLPAEIRATANLRAQLAMRVFDARNALGLTQMQYASRIGVSQSEISKIENGDSSISLKKITFNAIIIISIITIIFPLLTVGLYFFAI